MTETLTMLEDSTAILGDAGALRERADRDGYLFFRGLLPREDVLSVRRDLLSVVRANGWLASGQDELGDRVDVDALNRVTTEAMRTDIGVSAAAYDEVQCLESMHALPHHPRLLDLYRTLFGTEVLVHPRHIVRMISPHRDMVPTPIHQDYPHIQGTAETWTCWFPVGDCTLDQGGLAVLRASHRNGYLAVGPAAGAGGVEVQLCPRETEWCTTDYAAGDVLTFRSFTVHRGLPARVPGRMRLSMDVRYQSVSEVVEARSLLPHSEITWERIYAGWSREELKYYWRRLPLRMSPWNDALHRPGRRIC